MKLYYLVSHFITQFPTLLPSYTCGQCERFVRSSYNPAGGAGMCGALAEWYEKHRQRGTKPGPDELVVVYQQLGGPFGTPRAIFWPLSEREWCEKFR